MGLIDARPPMQSCGRALFLRGPRAVISAFVARPDSGGGQWHHLDFLRFVAAMGIVFHHFYEYLLSVDRRAAITRNTEGLTIFVDLFFCISDFMIIFMHANRVSSWRDAVRFISRRRSSLVPLHWLTMLFSMAIWVAVAISGNQAEHVSAFEALCIVPTILLLRAIFPCPPSTASVGPSAWRFSSLFSPPRRHLGSGINARFSMDGRKLRVWLETP